MTQIKNPTATRNTGPNHNGKFIWASRKLSHIVTEINKFSDRKMRTVVLRGSDLLSDVSIAIFYFPGLEFVGGEFLFA
jgi:hypothetical protein